MSEYIEVGYISGYFGVTGEVKLYSYTRPIGDITHYKKFYGGEDKAPIEFTRIKENKKHIIGKIANAANRNDVLGLIGTPLYILADDLPTLAADEYYWRDLIGLSVITTTGTELGRIDSIFETGANDVLVIKDKTANNETLIPYVLGHFVVDIDLANKQMTVDWEQDNTE